MTVAGLPVRRRRRAPPGPTAAPAGPAGRLGRGRPGERVAYRRQARPGAETDHHNLSYIESRVQTVRGSGGGPAPWPLRLGSSSHHDLRLAGGVCGQIIMITGRRPPDTENGPVILNPPRRLAGGPLAARARHQH